MYDAYRLRTRIITNKYLSTLKYVIHHHLVIFELGLPILLLYQDYILSFANDNTSLYCQAW